jgi:hypothetical protein
MQLKPIPGETAEQMAERYRKATIAAGMPDPGAGGLFGAVARRDEKPDMLANLPTDAQPAENLPAAMEPRKATEG